MSILLVLKIIEINELERIKVPKIGTQFFDESKIGTQFLSPFSYEWLCIYQRHKITSNAIFTNKIYQLHWHIT